MEKQELINLIKEKKSYLCIGLDSEWDKIPKHLLDLEDPVFQFNKEIIDATLPYAVGYKINTAFYESRGTDGWISLKRTLDYLPKSVFKIADAKRGDIGNTAKQYAKAFFETLPFDSITINPYMGLDSLEPFLEHNGKWSIILALTSNSGSNDFQMENNLWENILLKTKEVGTDENIMYVIGATKPEYMKRVRELVPNHFLLIPGVGAQGGNLEEISLNSFNNECGILVNSSRDIIFRSSSENFAEEAGKQSMMIAREMEILLRKINFLN